MTRSRTRWLGFGLLACLLLAGSAPASTWYVPDEIDLEAALAQAMPGDEIVIAVGVHEIQGAGHFVQNGVTIRDAGSTPGSVVIVEGPAWPYFREEPVFNIGSGAPVRIENITFRDFTRAFGPNEFVADPIFDVQGGGLVMDGCTFDRYHGSAVRFAAGTGEFSDCLFQGGHGVPAGIEFAGTMLVLRDCLFRENTQRFPGDIIAGDPVRDASILDLRSGVIECDGTHFADNGPVRYLVDVKPATTLTMCTSCLLGNHAQWEGRVAGTVTLNCCESDPACWQVVGEGHLISVGHGQAPVATENRTWSDVKALFE